MLLLREESEPIEQLNERLQFLPEEVRVVLYFIRLALDDLEDGPAAGGVEIDAPVDWQRVLGIARAHGVVPLLHRSMRMRNIEAVPDWFARQIQQDFHRIGFLISMQTRQLLNVWRLFKDECIPVLFFKGPLLAKIAYGNPVWRKPGDLDLLIHRKDYDRARALLLAHEYRLPLAPEVEEEYLSRCSEIVFEHEHSDIDLHWSLDQTAFNQLPYSVGFDQEDIWERSQCRIIDEVAVPCLSYDDTLFYLCTHGGKHAWKYLYMICDIAFLIRNKDDVDWNRLIGLAEALHCETLLDLALHLAHFLFDVDLPLDVVHRIQHNERLARLGKMILEQLFDPDEGLKSYRYHRIRAALLDRGADRFLYAWLLVLRRGKSASFGLKG